MQDSRSLVPAFLPIPDSEVFYRHFADNDDPERSEGDEAAELRAEPADDDGRGGRQDRQRRHAVEEGKGEEEEP